MQLQLQVACSVALLTGLAALPADATSPTKSNHPEAAIGKHPTSTRQLKTSKDSSTAVPVPLLPVKPRLGSAATPRKGAAAPAQVNVCQARIAAANKTASEVCGMSGVTLLGCMYSCRDKQRTTERCICCWPGLQLLNNSCEACPVGTFAKVSGTNECQTCKAGYSTNSEASIVCNGELVGCYTLIFPH
jgi:hypothetical protein